MGSTVSRIAFGAYLGAFAVFLGLTLAGMPDEARPVLGLMFLFCGVRFGALAYDKLRGGDC